MFFSFFFFHLKLQGKKKNSLFPNPCLHLWHSFLSSNFERTLQSYCLTLQHSSRAPIQRGHDQGQCYYYGQLEVVNGEATVSTISLSTSLNKSCVCKLTDCHLTQLQSGTKNPKWGRRMLHFTSLSLCTTGLLTQPVCYSLHLFYDKFDNNIEIPLRWVAFDGAARVIEWKTFP